MERQYGKIVGVEMYRTTDGTLFYDFESAEKHQSDLDAGDAAKFIVRGIMEQLGEVFDGFEWNK